MTLSEYLDQTGETQAVFGKRLTPPVSDGTVSRWVAGQMMPRPPRIREIELLTGGQVRLQDWFPPLEGDAA